jgi:hypothetical protein
MDISEIKSIIQDIKSSKIKNKEAYFANKYEDFKTKYPLLYEKACDDKFDIRNIDMMLKMLESIQTNEQSQFDASAKNRINRLLY